MSPRGQTTHVREHAKKVLNQLDHDAGQAELKAKRQLFKKFNAAGSSAHHTAVVTPKKKRNNKGDAVTLGSPDCGLSPTNPGRDGSRKSKRLDLTFSPEKKVEPVD